MNVRISKCATSFVAWMSVLVALGQDAQTSSSAPEGLLGWASTAPGLRTVVSQDFNSCTWSRTVVENDSFGGTATRTTGKPGVLECPYSANICPNRASETPLQAVAWQHCPCSTSIWVFSVRRIMQQLPKVSNRNEL